MINFEISSGKATNKNALTALPNVLLKKELELVQTNGISSNMAGTILNTPRKKLIKRCFLGSLLYSSFKMM
jgi:hypothetical protein